MDEYEMEARHSAYLEEKTEALAKEHDTLPTI